SKAYGVIERFSEDIDLSFHRSDLGFEHDTATFRTFGKNKRSELIKALKTRCQATIRDGLLPQLRADFERVLGPGSSAGPPWSLRLADDDPDLQTINFAYPPASSPPGEPSAIPTSAPSSGSSWGPAPSTGRRRSTPSGPTRPRRSRSPSGSPNAS